MSLVARPLALLGAFVVSACTFILVPDVDDDGVARCELASDCPPIEDTRYVAICVPGTDVPKGTPNICSSDYDEVPCGGYDNAHPLTDTLRLAVTHPEFYPPCSEQNIGTLGCGPGPEGCAPGLALNVYGSCDDPEAAFPAVGLDQTEPDEMFGRDVQDQFCRSFFCDERFVCDTRYQRPKCVPCSETRYLGRGGCGTLYVDGAPAWGYLDTESTGNCEGLLETDEIEYAQAPSP